MCNRISCESKEAATRFSNVCALWLAGLAIVGASRVRAADEAHATTGVPAAAAPTAAAGAPFVGGMPLGSSREPIAVTADSLVFDNRTRVLTYTGTVVATQGDMKLESNTLSVALDDHADSRLKEVVATGDVRLSNGARWATAGRAVFDQISRTVVLSDNAVLHDGLNQVSGEQVTVYLDQERSEVKGGPGRVKAILYPSQDATPRAGDHAP
jgi:lipopolysaccharide export system protein LptA